MGKQKRLLNWLNRQSQQIKDKVADLTVNKQIQIWGIGKEINIENTRKACIKLENQIKDIDQKKLNQTKINIVQGMYKETHDFIRNGKTKEEIFNFYWNIPEFQSCWIKLGFEDLNLKAIINQP